MLRPARDGGFGVSAAIAIPNTQLRDLTTRALLASSVRMSADLSAFRDVAELVAETERALPDLLLLGLPGLPVDGMEAVRQLRAADSALRIIVIHHSPEPEIILSAMRAGAGEFLYPPFAEQFEEAMMRVAGECAREQEGQRKNGSVFAFVSAKGGCGATTLACHAAVNFHARTKKQVLLADLDFATGIAAPIMRVNPRYSIADALQNLHRIDLTLWKALAGSTANGLDVIPPPPDPFDPIPHVRALNRLIGFWRSQYDYTILDLGRGLTPLACALLEGIDNLLLVTTAETASLRLTRHALRIAAKENCGRNRLNLVLNRLERRTSLQPSEVERLMDYPLFGVAAFDRRIAEDTYGEGAPGTADASVSPVAEIVAKLAGLPQETRKARRFAFLG